MGMLLINRGSNTPHPQIYTIGPLKTADRKILIRFDFLGAFDITSSLNIITDPRKSLESNPSQFL